MLIDISKRFIVEIVFGAGIIGAAAAWLIASHRLTKSIHHLTNQVADLRQEVQLLRGSLERQLPVIPDLKAGQSSLLLSSTDEDDLFEDAYSSDSNSEGITSDYAVQAADSSFYIHIDQLLDGSDDDQQAALQELHNRKQELANDVEFLWRLCKATYLISHCEAEHDREKQKTLIYQAVDYASCGLELDDSNPNIHKWYAITLGSTCDYESITVKIQNGYQFKDHIEKAIALNPLDPAAHYLLGRWCFSVYMLSWVERKMAATLFAIPPTATIDQALEHFLKAEKLNPEGSKENLLFVAKCYLEKRDYSTALEWLDKAEKVPVHGHDDEISEREVIGLLRQYSVHRH